MLARRWSNANISSCLTEANVLRNSLLVSRVVTTCNLDLSSTTFELHALMWRQRKMNKWTRIRKLHVTHGNCEAQAASEIPY